MKGFSQPRPCLEQNYQQSRVQDEVGTSKIPTFSTFTNQEKSSHNQLISKPKGQASLPSFKYDNNEYVMKVNDRINQFECKQQKVNKNKGQQGSWKRIKRLTSSKQNFPLSKQQSEQIQGRSTIKSSRIIIRGDCQNNQGQRWVEEIKKFIIEIKQEMRNYRLETAHSLKQGILKISDNLKKEVLIALSRQFLPLSFVQDSQMEVGNINKRIDEVWAEICMIKSQYERKNHQKDIQEEIIKQSGFGPSIIIKQLVSRMEAIQSSLSSLSLKVQPIFNLNMKFCENQTKFSRDANITQIDFAKTIQPLNFEPACIQQVKNVLKLQLDSAQPIEKHHINSETEQNNLIGCQYQKRRNSRELSLTYSLQSLPEEGNCLGIKSPAGLKNIYTSFKDIKSVKYIIDNDCQIMDQSGNYILDQLGNPIKLNENQMRMLKQSEIVKYREQ